ncbi:MAG: YdbL family protein [Candidatus Anammoxibacter sp.]
MKKYLGKRFLPCLLGVLAFGCATITVNIYFPAEAVEQAAEDILNEIEGFDTEEVDETTQDESELQSYLWMNIRDFIVGGSLVYAGDNLNLDLTSPAIRKVIDSMKTRTGQIRQFKNTGVIGETFDGKLEARDLSTLGGKDIKMVKQLLKAENADRNALYKELAKANKISEAEVSKIGKVFAKTRRTKLNKKGQWYKDESGNWTQIE